MTAGLIGAFLPLTKLWINQEYQLQFWEERKRGEKEGAPPPPPPPRGRERENRVKQKEGGSERLCKRGGREKVGGKKEREDVGGEELVQGGTEMERGLLLYLVFHCTSYEGSRAAGIRHPLGPRGRGHRRASS